MPRLFVPLERLKIKHFAIQPFGRGRYATYQAKLDETSSDPKDVAVKALRLRKPNTDETHSEDLKVFKDFNDFRWRAKLGEQCAVRHFKTEVEIRARLAHPNILPFLGYSLDPSRITAYVISPYLVNRSYQEYVGRRPEGIPFARRLNFVSVTVFSGGLSDQLMITIMKVRDITMGLEFLHSQRPAVCRVELHPVRVLFQSISDILSTSV